MILVGVARDTVNPGDGVLLGGYPTDRPRRSEGVHDDLEVSAVSSSDDTAGTHTILVAFDGISVPSALVVALDNAFGPDVRAIAVASHTHSAPSVPAWDQEIIGQYDPAYTTSLVDRCLDVAARALAAEAPGWILAGSASLTESVGTNRRHDGGPHDDRVRVVEIQSASRDPLLLLVVYGCHPTVLGADNRLVSADLVGGIRKGLGDVPVAFLPGGAGNQSTRETRAGGSFGECERLGSIVADAVRAARTLLRPCPISRSTDTRFRMQPRLFPDVEESERRVDESIKEQERRSAANGSDVEIRSAEVEVIGALHDLRRARSEFAMKDMEVRVSMWDLGPVSLAFWPVEPGMELAETLETREGSWLCGYSNGYLGYLLDAEDFHRGGYEVAASPFGRNSSDAFFDATHRLQSG